MGKKLLISFVIFCAAFFSEGKASASASVDTFKKSMVDCDVVLFKAIILQGGNNISIVIDFGDGSLDGMMLDSGGVYYATHAYHWAGSYDVKMWLYDNSVLVDSAGLTYQRFLDDCAEVYNYFYFDENNNCVKDSNEYSLTYPLQVEVTSYTNPADTLPALNGLKYIAKCGMGGDIFTFRPIALPPDMYMTCPTNGFIGDTLMGPGLVFHNYFGFNCNTSNNFDLGVHAVVPVTGSHDQWGHIYVTNPLCYDLPATLTLTHSPKYHYTGGASPTPTSVNGNVITWNLNNVGVSADIMGLIYFELWSANGPLVVGDTVHNYITVTPSNGDMNLANNSMLVIDTVRASCDPNAIYVTPGGCVTPGTKLNYEITFENIGNAPAENIWVLDTLPAGLDVSSVCVLFSSHEMFVSKRKIAGQTILRFDFPNIMLPDSSDHENCHGMLEYTIDVKDNWPIGSNIDHRAGIYFDLNGVVMTNTAQTGMCWPASVEEAASAGNFILYPNPAKEILIIKTEDHGAYEITNTIGQLMTEGKVQKGETEINVKALPAGIYNIKLSGQHGVKVQRFQKL